MSTSGVSDAYLKKILAYYEKLDCMKDFSKGPLAVTWAWSPTVTPSREGLYPTLPTFIDEYRDPLRELPYIKWSVYSAFHGWSRTDDSPKKAWANRIYASTAQERWWGSLAETQYIEYVARLETLRRKTKS